MKSAKVLNIMEDIFDVTRLIFWTENAVWSEFENLNGESWSEDVWSRMVPIWRGIFDASLQLTKCQVSRFFKSTNFDARFDLCMTHWSQIKRKHRGIVTYGTSTCFVNLFLPNINFEISTIWKCCNICYTLGHLQLNFEDILIASFL